MTNKTKRFNFEMITEHLGHILKIDELTISLTWSKFTRVCIKIDLSKPLAGGFRIGDGSHHVFIVVLYERLPTFCYSCGIIGNGSNSCTRSVMTGDTRALHPLVNHEGWR